MIDPEVASVYDDGAHEEWSRLETRRVEFGVTCLALDEFLPPTPARILDVGSGPGRYAIRLAGAGYAVSLVDVSQRSLDVAAEKASEAGVRFHDAVRASAHNLTAFQSNEFDAVLQLGPLYHMKSMEARLTALHEALRVTRPGGMLFAAHLNRYSVVRYAAKMRPWQLSQARDFIDSILRDGVGDAADGFLRTCYCADPAEIRPLMERAGWHTVAMVGCEGIVADVEERLNELDAAQFANWVALNYQLGRKPDLLASSAHILYIGQKR
jgi:ubiquinone/menaquinone biosynthesis C-methylase UbiE